jgi:hypothetical protein
LDAEINTLEIEILSLKELIDLSPTKLDADFDQSTQAIQDADQMMKLTALSGLALVLVLFYEIIKSDIPAIRRRLVRVKKSWLKRLKRKK